MIAVVSYRVDVDVYVDTETRRVTHVLQLPETIALAIGRSVLDDEGYPVDQETAENAVQISEEAEWPSWDRS